MLDEFSTAKINLSEDATPKVDAQLTKVENDADVSQEAADDFNKQLQDQMAALMGNIDESPEMKWEIEAMMRELGVRADAHKTKDGADLLEGEANGSEPLSRAEEPFQKTITKTMERMQASEDHAMMAATSEDEDDILAKMLEEMQNGNSEGAADDEGFNRMLMGMMEQLTNKDILYEPMKELHDKFPAWMTKNRSSTGPDDLRRYENQQGLVAEIVEKFEQQQYSDSKAEDREFIVERMQQVNNFSTTLLSCS